MEGEVVAEEQDGGPGGEDEGGVELWLRFCQFFVFFGTGGRVRRDLRLAVPSRGS